MRAFLHTGASIDGFSCAGVHIAVRIRIRECVWGLGAVLVLAGLIAPASAYALYENPQGWVVNEVNLKQSSGWGESFPDMRWDGRSYVQDNGLLIPERGGQVGNYLREASATTGPLADGEVPYLEQNVPTNEYEGLSRVGTYTVVTYFGVGARAADGIDYMTCWGQPALSIDANPAGVESQHGGDIVGYYFPPNEQPPAIGRAWALDIGSWAHESVVQRKDYMNARGRIIVVYLPRHDGSGDYNAYVSLAFRVDGLWNGYAVDTWQGRVFHKAGTTETIDPFAMHAQIWPGFDSALSVIYMPPDGSHVTAGSASLHGSFSSLAVESQTDTAALTAKKIVEDGTMWNDMIDDATPTPEPTVTPPPSIEPSISTGTVQPPDIFPPGASGWADQVAQWLIAKLNAILDPMRDLLWFLTGG